MNRKIIFRCALAVGIGLVNTFPVKAEHGLLSGGDIQSTLAGATAEGTTSKGKEYEVEYTPNGDLKMSMKDNSFWDRGNWRINGDTYCAKWEKIRKGAENCWRLRHKAGSTYVFEGVDGAEDVEAVLSR